MLVKLDDSLSEAAYDLGATKFQTFTKVIFPLSLPGVISGIQMVFMPSLTFYMIPDILNEGWSPAVTQATNTMNIRPA